VPLAGGVAGGALPKSAGTSFHGRRKPNGSACQRRTMAGVQDEAKHAMSAMSPLKSCDVEKPQPQRCERIGPLTSPHEADDDTRAGERWRLAAAVSPLGRSRSSRRSWCATYGRWWQYGALAFPGLVIALPQALGY
jgi:hypothetical protein